MSEAPDWAAGIAAAEDYALPEPEDTPGFNETFCFTGYDAPGELGWFMHLVSRPAPWRSRLVLYLPGGEDFIQAAAEGGERRPRRPGADAIHAECLEPFRRWRLRGEAVGRRTSRADMLARRPPEGEAVPIAIDATVEAATPLWALGYGDGASAEQQGARGFRTHHHQLMMTQGQVRAGADVWEISGPSWRDHSRGPRTLTTWGSHALVGVWFPQSRRGFGLIRQQDATGALMTNAAYIVEDGRLSPARVANITPLTDVARRRDAVSLVLQAGDGRRFALEGEVVTQTLGPIGAASWISEGQTRWTLDGEVSFGLCERSVRSA